MLRCSGLASVVILISAKSDPDGKESVTALIGEFSDLVTDCCS